MNRREFLGIVGVGAFHKLALPKLDAPQPSGVSAVASGVQANESKPYGSGHFGEWVTDRFGLPAYRYTCNQVTDPKRSLRCTSNGGSHRPHPPGRKRSRDRCSLKLRIRASSSGRRLTKISK